MSKITAGYTLAKVAGDKYIKVKVLEEIKTATGIYYLVKEGRSRPKRVKTLDNYKLIKD